MESLKQAQWSRLQAFRARVAELQSADSLAEAAQSFATEFVETFDSVVLARVFVVLEYGALPPAERAFARELAQMEQLPDSTRVLTLLGTRGKEDDWNDRLRSQAHHAIPLVSAATVREAPMIAKLLADLEVDLRVLDDGRPLATRQLLLGRRGTFFVADALSSTDDAGRLVIPARSFVEEHAVRSVFGMGGAYVDGTLVVSVLFCSEVLDRAFVERFTTFIDAFKVATADKVKQKRLFAGPSD